MNCLHCGGSLRYRHGPAPGWVHQGVNHGQEGSCFCYVKPHTTSHDERGQLICPTWRTHEAIPNLKEEK